MIRKRLFSTAATAAIPKTSDFMPSNSTIHNPLASVTRHSSANASVTSLLQLLSRQDRHSTGGEKGTFWKRNRVVAGWKLDALLESFIAEGNVKDAVSIMNGLKHLDSNKISSNSNDCSTSAATAGCSAVDSYTLAACIRGFLAFYDHQHYLSNSSNDRQADDLVKEEPPRDYVHLVVDFVGKDSVELHELIAALHRTGLHKELESIFEVWRFMDYNANHSGHVKSLLCLDHQQLDYSESKFIKTCNSLADYFAEKGDLATVVYITKKVFRLGILNQSHHLFQCQIKASGHSLSRHSPVMSIKQMENKKYVIDSKTMAIFMQSMIPSGRYHAVYEIYKKLQALNQNEEKNITGIATNPDTCVEMIEAMMDTLVKECISASIDPSIASFPAPEYTFYSSFYDAHLDTLLESFLKHSRFHSTLAPKKINRWLKTRHEKYALVMHKYITSQRQKHNIKPTARLLYLDLLYALLTFNTRSIYHIVESLMTKPDDIAEWKREEEEEWRRIHLILYRLKLISDKSIFPSCFYYQDCL